MINILLAMGNVFEKYPNMQPNRKKRIENICNHLAKQFSKNNKFNLFHGGRKDALSCLILEKLDDKFKEGNVSTYIPKTEIDNSRRFSDYAKIGNVFEVGSFPEERREALVKIADVVLVSDGFRGVTDIHRIARKMHKRIIPITFGVEDNNMLVEEQLEFSSLVNESNDQNLKNLWTICTSINSTTSIIAESYVSLISNYFEGNIRQNIFVTLPLIEEAKSTMRDVTSAIQSTLAEYKFSPIIIVDTDGEKPLIDEIIEGMNKSIALVSILDYNRPNIYFESGYMKGQEKPVMYFCNKSSFSEVAFDTKAFELLVWDGIEDFKDKLRKRLDTLIKQKLLPQ